MDKMVEQIDVHDFVHHLNELLRNKNIRRVASSICLPCLGNQDVSNNNASSIPSLLFTNADDPHVTYLGTL